MAIENPYIHRTPLTERIRGTKPKTIDDHPAKHAATAHQDARPHRVPEPSREKRLRGSCPWEGEY
jgi:hypothetical protein